MRKAGMVFIGTVLLVGSVAADDGATKADPAAAAALAAAERWPEAIDAYRAVVEAQPTNGAAWFALGQAQMAVADHDAAVTAFTQALSNGANQGALGVVRAYAAKGDKAQAIGWLERIASFGAPIYGQVMAASELEPLHDDPAFQAVAAKLKPCADPAHRQFDFWLGSWDVENVLQPGGPGGRNHITGGHGGCAILENYTAGTYTGQSVNYYNAARGTWHQTWIDNQGFALELEGKLENGSMVLSSDASQSPINRITWTPNDDGTVRQLWETSSDGGTTWTVSFDGLYTQRE